MRTHLRALEVLANVYEGQAAIERVALVLQAIMEGRDAEGVAFSLEEAREHNRYGWYIIHGRSLTQAALGQAYRLAQEETAV